MNTTATLERQAVAQSAINPAPSFQLPTIFSMPENDAIATLQASFYPGAKRESVIAVLSYCRAANLDPIQRPVHIVPMYVKTGERDADGDVYEWRDIVLPGIGLYRIQATRTGCYVGQDEPQFGPLKTLTYSKKFTSWESNASGRRFKKDRWEDVTIEYPEWCKVTVYRFVQGRVCPFVARELWVENYGTSSAFSAAPNKMWERRIFAQLAKCSEAQALRKAFPDAVGSGPTADEMEGKLYDLELTETGDTAEPAKPPAPTPPRKAAAPAPAAEQGPEGQGDHRPDPDQQPAQESSAAAPAATPAPAPGAPKPGEFMATGGERQNLIVKANRQQLDLQALLNKHLAEAAQHVNPQTLDGLTKEQFKTLRNALA